MPPAPIWDALPMAQTGYEEEARLYAQATVLPGSESGGFGQNDVASPVFLAWSKQDRAGRCLDMALASLVPIALRALDVTDRPVPAAIGQPRSRGPRICARFGGGPGFRPLWWPRLRAPCRAPSIHPDALRSAANVLSRRPALSTMRVQPPGGEEPMRHDQGPDCYGCKPGHAGAAVHPCQERRPDLRAGAARIPDLPRPRHHGGQRRAHSRPDHLGQGRSHAADGLAHAYLRGADRLHAERLDRPRPSRTRPSASRKGIRSTSRAAYPTTRSRPRTRST